MPIRKCASKKGRMSSTSRREMNEQRIHKIVSGKMDGTVFARVTKIVGGCLVRAALDCMGGRQEVLVRIPSGFKRKGATPITTSAIVSIFVGKEFDPETDRLAPTDKFDLVAILGHKQASFLQKEGTIPAWMMVDVAADSLTASTAGWEFECEDSAAELFSASGKPLASLAEGDGEDAAVDVDKI